MAAKNIRSSVRRSNNNPKSRDFKRASIRQMSRLSGLKR